MQSNPSNTWRDRAALIATALLAAGLSVAAAQSAHTTSRLTFVSASAIIAGTTQGLTASATGEWQDSSGRRFTVYDIPTSAGHGYTQVDIVYADDQVCVGTVTIFMIDIMTNALTTLSSSGFVTPGDACADYWVSPAKLAQNEAFISPGLNVTRGPLQRSNGTVVEVVGHRTTTSAGISQQTYEAATGLLLIGSTAIQGAAVPTLGPGNVVTPGSGGSTLTFTELVNVRQFQVPTASAVLPDHVRNVRELVYQCVTGTRLGQAVTEAACDARYTVVARGPQWLSLSSVTRIQNPLIGTFDVSEGSAVVAMGVGAGGLFVSPEVLAQLAPGQQVDQDPVTNARTVVQGIDGRTVTFNVINDAESAWLVYDLSNGWLVETYLEKAVGSGSSFIRLTLAGVN